MSVAVLRWDDPISWNEFVASTPGAHFQQSWEWGELSPLLGGRAVRLGAVSSGSLIGAMQIFIQPVGRTGASYIYVPRGPALAQASVQVLGALLDAARAVGKDAGALGIRLEPNVAAGTAGWPDMLRSLSLRPSYPPQQPRSSWVLDIRPSEDDLLAQMKQKTRYNIGLAARKGVEVSEAEAGELEAFYALYRATAQRDDFSIQSEQLYATMFRLFRESGSFAMLMARYKKEALAAVTLIQFGDTCWYMHGASGNEHRNLMAPHLLQWEAIKWAKARGCRLYDFRAVPDVLQEDQDMYGVYRFKAGFGGYQLTTLSTFAAPYRYGLHGLWQLYFTGRFAVDAWRRRRQGLPARQFA